MPIQFPRESTHRLPFEGSPECGWHLVSGYHSMTQHKSPWTGKDNLYIYLIYVGALMTQMAPEGVSMDLSFSAEHELFRERLRTFLEEGWTRPRTKGEKVDASAFRAAAIERGYLYRGIPQRLGGSEQAPDVVKARIIAEEFERVRAPGEIKGVGTQMLVPTLLECGTEWQKDRFIPRTLTGEYRWCQGYSEPGSGSDLASLRTRGVLEGDEWVVTGQKVWTSYAKQADFMFALVRTEPDAPKHEGISYLLIDMRSPGVDVRPLKQINGGEEFNEVFLNEVRTPADWIVGERGKGWLVSKSLLKHERNMIGGVDRSDKLFSSLLALARRTMRDARPAIEDAWVRDRLAALKARLEIMRYSSFIQFTRENQGQPAGRTQMMNKLYQSNYAAEVARLATELLGDIGLLSPIGVEKPGSERWLEQYMNSLAAAIAGGASNIQRNIIAERGLGLPRDKEQ